MPNAYNLDLVDCCANISTREALSGSHNDRQTYEEGHHAVARAIAQPGCRPTSQPLEMKT